MSLNKIQQTQFEECLEQINDTIAESAHYIPEQVKSHRRVLLDWVMTVSSKLELREETLFTAIEIFDKILIAYKFKLSVNDMHLVGIVSLFLASKYEEVVPIRLQTLIEKIGHSKFSKEDILSSEMLILRKLNFLIPRNHFVNFSHSMVKMFICDEKSLGKQQIFNEEMMELFKITLYDFKLSRTTHLFTLYFTLFQIICKKLMKTSLSFSGIICEKEKVKKYFQRVNCLISALQNDSIPTLNYYKLNLSQLFSPTQV
jgi:hypothetical protein